MLSIGISSDNDTGINTGIVTIVALEQIGASDYINLICCLWITNMKYTINLRIEGSLAF